MVTGTIGEWRDGWETPGKRDSSFGGGDARGCWMEDADEARVVATGCTGTDVACGSGVEHIRSRKG